MPSFRTLLVLGRVSNLPTVWSNCLAGWWLGGGGNRATLPFLFAGVTLLYLGGMFLNDAFDERFDRQHRTERPIPSGRISAGLVWRSGFGLLVAGELLLFGCGAATGVLGIALALCILLYDAIHKAFTFSPLLMGACRFVVYLIAASTGVTGVGGWAIWSGLALGVYVVGLSFIARRETRRGPMQYWPAGLLAAPVLLALLINVGAYRDPALLLSLVCVMWVLRCLRTVYWTHLVNVGRSVSGLLAGIVLVDWVATVESPHKLSYAFIGLFLSALLAQRFIPAT
jgi:4-hydroxybenzoate polyprenyltransferase